jgi:hypothetical protein
LGRLNPISAILLLPSLGGVRVVVVVVKLFGDMAKEKMSQSVIEV